MQRLSSFSHAWTHVVQYRAQNLLPCPFYHKSQSSEASNHKSTDEATIISLFSLSFLSRMDAGAPAEVMSMALAKTVEAHGTKKRKHPAETTADKLKAIALSKPPSPGSLIKQVQVMSLVDDLFLDLDRVFSSNAQY